MLDNFLFNVKHGINHVLDIHAYDHILFLIMLSIPFVFKDWKRVIVLVTVFTLGHTLSLILATYNVVRINSQIVEFLIPITILIVAVYNIFTAGKGPQKEKIGLLFITTLFFGLIHGLGFAREFEKLQKPSDNKFILLLEFALGIEIAQIIIVFLVLFISYVVQTIFRFTKRDWVMIISAIVVGLTIPMILKNPIF
ncbi:HupE/UreJ family protein [Oceanihabitans sp. IOP_32]|uniref:HupE/UreJ family protein n=1 Tax=Oceanihabitans sp. IOP_32 TaxID=2529032 RepID=UPI0012933A83|nr:HupE/UreJ family protein [Oceanihabitans sp. IOP_32]QFZ54610.1 HupE/UreJ family protein [Oceanihabitans sp. IOP_32]